MTASLNQLITQLPSDTAGRVNQAHKQFLTAIQGEMRKESGLLLNRKLSPSVKNKVNQVSIPITVTDGIPVLLRNVELDLSYWYILPLAPYHSLLTQMGNSGTELSQITDDLENNIEESKTDDEPMMVIDFEVVGKYSKYLADLIDQTNPVKRILGINGDVLGSYDHTNADTPKISLYWAVIGIVANLLSIKPETLTCVVLVHELAHGYSHVGTDIDGERWDTQSFHHSDIALKEGIAQYYTHLICRRLNSRIPNLFDSYNLLLKEQPDAYRTHLSWVDNYSPEIVRMAIIEARRNRIKLVSDFESMLKDARNRLNLALYPH